ncbi:hypothetical protein K443DRAFT_282693 [Laccaria amethystina LaAM-08-1]|uniref:Unplaced genomic scaffold K443scaffold_183, whole genome shotgun sequence n=1 Tax=Laccaria amethystina LaAM-08-1 TaxID=1095629 RepID=A0A0C9WVN6_9AGAR|nr:hypothetical protein K443DRAFT_282693 [Laccaria amethystina LaAM-08-1]
MNTNVTWANAVHTTCYVGSAFPRRLKESGPSLGGCWLMRTPFPQRAGPVLIANHVWSTERRHSRSYRMQRRGHSTLFIQDSPSTMFSRSNVRSRLCGLHCVPRRPHCDLVLPVEPAADVNRESHL